MTDKSARDKIIAKRDQFQEAVEHYESQEIWKLSEELNMTYLEVQEIWTGEEEEEEESD